MDDQAIYDLIAAMDQDDTCLDDEENVVKISTEVDSLSMILDNISIESIAMNTFSVSSVGSKVLDQNKQNILEVHEGDTTNIFYFHDADN
eukprot:7977081-Ditylum_brightwellii.AAC.1